MTFLLASSGRKAVIKLVISGRKRLQIKMRWSKKLHRIYKKSLVCRAFTLSLK